MNESLSTQTLLDLNLTHGGDPDRARRTLHRFDAFDFDFVHLPLYRTEQLVSSVHAPEQARWFRASQLDFTDVPSLRETARETGSTLVCTVYDRELLDRYREEFPGAPIFLDPGDLTFGRLLDRLDNPTRPVWVGLSHPAQDVPQEFLNKLEKTGGGILIRQPLHPDEPPALRPETLDHLAFPGPERRGFSATAGQPGWTATALNRGCEILRFPLGPLAHQFPSDSSEPLESFRRSLESIDSPDSLTELDNGHLEIQWRDYLRDCERSLMADRSLSAGSTLRPDMVRELRPGGGLPAAKFDSCTNMLIPRPADPGEMIAYS